MTRKDYKLLAHFLGRAEADLHMGPLRNELRAEGFTLAMRAVIAALQSGNVRFDNNKFLDAVEKE